MEKITLLVTAVVNIMYIFSFWSVTNNKFHWSILSLGDFFFNRTRFRPLMGATWRSGQRGPLVGWK
jgi:hypothetical protein